MGATGLSAIAASRSETARSLRPIFMWMTARVSSSGARGPATSMARPSNCRASAPLPSCLMAIIQARLFKATILFGSLAMAWR